MWEGRKAPQWNCKTDQAAFAILVRPP